MGDVLGRLYTGIDTVIKFFSWVYDSAQLLGSWISEKFSLITDLCAAVPASWALAISVMAAAALIYLVVGR